MVWELITNPLYLSFAVEQVYNLFPSVFFVGMAASFAKIAVVHLIGCCCNLVCPSEVLLPRLDHQKSIFTAAVCMCAQHLYYRLF